MFMQYEGNDTYSVYFDGGKEIELTSEEIDEFKTLNLSYLDEIIRLKNKILVLRGQMREMEKKLDAYGESNVQDR